ncbi:hypothetical protein Misp01_27490 [Microtetraspora sp. NBRC 13810]|uniref:hypothetical protein n=1 Tax=Microtetraspora sp. NBRC 13810 TaxID=3030990 RepID=UPI0024A2DB01|nr:hypothetical protein [Microtetraspora sp. NBRC 13810]GLW07619.1 hypothetical protein Misp01_27490 [Microtetraspora sp. NBRC 13810]
MEIPLFTDRRWSTCPLWVLEGNERARRFCEKAGWSADGVTRVAPMGGELTHQLLRVRTATR